MEDADFVLRSEPQHGKARYRRAWALLELGRRNEARQLLEQLDPSEEVDRKLRRPSLKDSKRYNSILNYIISYYTILYYILLYYIILYCIYKYIIQC